MTIDDALNEFLKSNYWSELYKNAPPRVQVYLKANFATSLLDYKDKEHRKAWADLKRAQSELTKTDCQWLLDNGGQSGLARWHYKTLMDNAKE